MYGSAIALDIFSVRNINLKEGLGKTKKKTPMDLKHGNIAVNQLMMLVHSIYVYVYIVYITEQWSSHFFKL